MKKTVSPQDLHSELRQILTMALEKRRFAETSAKSIASAIARQIRDVVENLISGKTNLNSMSKETKKLWDKARELGVEKEVDRLLQRLAAKEMGEALRTASNLVTADAKFTETEARQLAAKYKLNFRAVVGFLDELLEGAAPYWVGKRVAEYEKRKTRGE